MWQHRQCHTSAQNNQSTYTELLPLLASPLAPPLLAPCESAISNQCAELWFRERNCMKCHRTEAETAGTVGPFSIAKVSLSLGELSIAATRKNCASYRHIECVLGRTSCAMRCITCSSCCDGRFSAFVFPMARRKSCTRSHSFAKLAFSSDSIMRRATLPSGEEVSWVRKRCLGGIFPITITKGSSVGFAGGRKWLRRVSAGC